MHIIIGGAQVTGKFLTREFCKEDLEQNYSITVIDEDPREIQSISQQYNVATVCSSITNFEVLKQNIRPQTLAFVACSEKEETNIIACILAHSLGVKNNIAVTETANYNQEQITEKYYKSGVKHIINTTKVLKEEIVKLAKFSSSVQINYFANDKVVLYGFVVEKNFAFVNKQIREIPRDSFFLIGATSRLGVYHIPDGNWKIQLGDKLFVLFPKEKLAEFEKEFIVKTKSEKNAVLFGEQNLIKTLASDLLQEGFSVNIICEDNAEQKFFQKNILPSKKACKFSVGSVLDLFFQEKISKNKFLFVAFSENDSKNLTACMIAKHLNVQKTIAAVNHRNLLNPAQKMGVDVSLAKKAVINRLVQQLVHYGDYSPDFTTVENTDIEVLSLPIKKSSPWIGLPLHKIQLPKNSLIGIITNQERVIIPRGDTKVRENDNLIFFTLPRNLIRLKQTASGENEKG
jgi:trk system potassium uptake protein TrkA